MAVVWEGWVSAVRFIDALLRVRPVNMITSELLMDYAACFSLRIVNPLCFSHSSCRLISPVCCFWVKSRADSDSRNCRTGPVPMATVWRLDCVYRWRRQKPGVRFPMRLCLKVGQSLPSGAASSRIPSDQSAIFLSESTLTTGIRRRGQCKAFISKTANMHGKQCQPMAYRRISGAFWVFSVCVCVCVWETPDLDCCTCS